MIMIFFSHKTLAQDEKIFRELLTFGEKEKKNQLKDLKKAGKWVIHSKVHLLDLNDDGLPEGLYFTYRDGIPWISVLDANNRLVFESSMQIKGFGAKPYKINIVNLSSKVKLLLIHFYEGAISYLGFHGTARAYFLTIDHQDLESIFFYSGPQFFEEVEEGKEHYHQRQYSMKIEDFNQDGIKDVMISYKSIHYTYFYLGRGNWKVL